MLREPQVGNEIVGVGVLAMGNGVADEDIRQMLSSSRAKQILTEMNQARLGELQEAHDAARYEANRLKQKQQSGTQQHMVVSEKRNLARLIGKANKVKKQSINSMMPFVRYIVQNTENHGIPDDWKKGLWTEHHTGVWTRGKRLCPQAYQKNKVLLRVT